MAGTPTRQSRGVGRPRQEWIIIAVMPRRYVLNDRMNHHESDWLWRAGPTDSEWPGPVRVRREVLKGIRCRPFRQSKIFPEGENSRFGGTSLIIPSVVPRARDPNKIICSISGKCITIFWMTVFSIRSVSVYPPKS